jgi:uncharacterized Fe-S radical SAM superfamily protein PflX
MTYNVMPTFTDNIVVGPDRINVEAIQNHFGLCGVGQVVQVQEKWVHIGEVISVRSK